MWDREAASCRRAGARTEGVWEGARKGIWAWLVSCGASSLLWATGSTYQLGQDPPSLPIPPRGLDDGGGQEAQTEDPRVPVRVYKVGPSLQQEDGS